MVLHQIKWWALLLLFPAAVFAQTTVFNCSSFSSTGSCGVHSGPGQAFSVAGAYSNLNGSVVTLIPAGDTHSGEGLNYYPGTVSAQAFTSTFTFKFNGQNISFVIQNAIYNNGYTGPYFEAGAGCEAGFYQDSTPPIPPGPAQLFVVELDGYSNTGSTGSFSYSTAQVYQAWQTPCNPQQSPQWWWQTTKNSTSPVSLNSPSGTQNSPSSDTFSATISYDGANFGLCLYDVTAANGSCSSGTSGTGTYFQETWANVDIPQMVNGTTAYASIVAGNGLAAPADLDVLSWSFTNLTAPGTHTLSTYTSQSGTGSPYTANPTFSPAAGSYSGTQNVSLACATTGCWVCYETGTTPPAIMPQPTQLLYPTGPTTNASYCQTGTHYTGPIAVSSTQTIWAIAGGDINSNGTSTTGYAYIPSNTVAASYTITGSAPRSYTGKFKCTGNCTL